MKSAADLADTIRRLGRTAYMPYLTVGDPSLDLTVEFAVALADAGADLIELGIPFSDPTADGPVIQAAMERALHAPGFSLPAVIHAVARIHAARPELPLVFLTYLNPVLNAFSDPARAKRALDAGSAVARFLEESRTVGIRGIVIPDLPHDQPEAALLRREGALRGIHPILMVAPNSSEERMLEVCANASGFIYAVTSLGVTGERSNLPEDLATNMRRLRGHSPVPVFAGFGINRPEQVAALIGVVDGIIVGSLHHRIIAEKGSLAGPALAAATAAFAAAVRAAPAAALG